MISNQQVDGPWNKEDLLFMGLKPYYWSHTLVPIHILSNALTPCPPPYDTVYQWRGIFLKKVCVAGFIIEVSISAKTVVYTVDDGTGCISCVRWLDPQERNCADFTPLRLGTFVAVKGRLQEHLHAIQVTSHSIEENDDPNAQHFYWLETMNSLAQIMKLGEIDEENRAMILKHMDASSSFLDNDDDLMGKESTLKVKPPPRLDVWDFTSLPEYQILMEKGLQPQGTVECDVIDFLRKYLPSQFRFDQAIRSESLLALGSRCIASQYQQRNISTGRIETLMSRCVNALCREGYLMHVDVDQGVFEVFNAQKHVWPVLVEVIGKCERELRQGGRTSGPSDRYLDGIPTDYIVAQCKADHPALVALPKASIVAALKGLEADGGGGVYSVGDDRKGVGLGWRVM